MHRLNPTSPPPAAAWWLAAALLSLSCSRPQRIPIKTVPIDTDAPVISADGTPVGAPPSNECPGNEIDDLDGMIDTGDCDATPPANVQLSSLLNVTASLASPDVPSGGRVEVRIVFENRSTEKLPVYFYRDPKVEFPMIAVNSKGVDQTYPEGGAPTDLSGSIARIVLAPKGTIKVRATFYAIRYKWKKTGKNQDLIEAGGLRRGDYTIRVRLPLAGKVGKSQEQLELPIRVK